MRRPPYREWTRLMFACDYSKIPDSPQFVRFLIHCRRNHSDKRMRYICAHHARLTKNDRLRSAVIARASDFGEQPTVRGECLESFTMNWSRPWSRTDRKAHRTVIHCLRDADHVGRQLGESQLIAAASPRCGIQHKEPRRCGWDWRWSGLRKHMAARVVRGAASHQAQSRPAQKDPSSR